MKRTSHRRTISCACDMRSLNLGRAMRDNQWKMAESGPAPNRVSSRCQKGKLIRTGAIGTKITMKKTNAQVHHVRGCGLYYAAEARKHQKKSLREPFPLPPSTSHILPCPLRPALDTRVVQIRCGHVLCAVAANSWSPAAAAAAAAAPGEERTAPWTKVRRGKAVKRHAFLPPKSRRESRTNMRPDKHT